jgi:GMP synthase (glutamine-hydrolysing)
MSQAHVVSYSEPFKGNADNFIDDTVSFIRKYMSPRGNIVIPVSGGIDSRVTYELFKKAIDPRRVFPMHIDTGYMRLIRGFEEPELVAKTFKSAPNFEVINARDRFYKSTFGIEDAEEKRKGYQGTYNAVITEVLEKHNIVTGSDGTIGPDIAETKGGEYKGVKLGKLKTQHNVGNDPFEEKIEPLASISKDEVRIVGRALGIPEELSNRQPFPGPALSIRIPGIIDTDKLNTEKRANDIVEKGVEYHFKRKYGKPYIYDSRTGERIPFQYFAATMDSSIDESNSLGEEVGEYVKGLVGRKLIHCDVLKNKATGMKVKDDRFERTYEPMVLMTVTGEVDSTIIKHIGETVPEEFPVSRVLQEIKIGQGPYNISIRAVKSRNALSASPIILPRFEGIARELKRECVGINSICVDTTPKPPATIEYE